MKDEYTEYKEKEKELYEAAAKLKRYCYKQCNEHGCSSCIFAVCRGYVCKLKEFPLNYDLTYKY